MKTFLPYLALLFFLANTPQFTFAQAKFQLNPRETKSPTPAKPIEQAFTADTSPLINQPSANPGAPVFSQQWISPYSAEPLSVGSANPTKKNSSSASVQTVQSAGENRLSLQENVSQTSQQASAIACDETPIGTDDNYLTSNDRALVIAAPGFLANDIDLQGEALIATLILDNVDHGTLAAFGDGSFNYTPQAGFVGTDQFQYRMRDASFNLSEPITVIIEVLEKANRNPIGTNDRYVAVSNATLNIAAPGFLQNDLDQDGEAIAATIILDNVDHGTLAAFGDGSFIYTPTPGYTGPDQFQYRLRDAFFNFSEAVTVVIEVVEGNRPPVGINDLFGVVVNTSLSIAAPGFLANDFDPDGEALTATLIAASPAHGSISAFGDGSFTYTPTPGYQGTDQFQYRMRDASFNISDPITVTLEVISAGTLPVGFEDHYYTSNNKPINQAAPGFLANDIDGNGEPLTATLIVASPDHGSLTAFPDGSFTYTPSPGYIGPDQFQYTMRDASFNQSEPITVHIEVAEPANRPPVGTEDTYAALANNSLSIPAPGFLINDIDPDGEAITATVILQSPSHGSISAFGDGSFMYTPNVDYTGTDQFQYRMRDASFNLSDPVTVTINVLEGNRSPVGVNDTYAVVKNTALSVAASGFLRNDFDVDGDALTATLIFESPSHGGISAFPDGSFTYIPNPEYTGPDQFQYRMQDASGNPSEPVLVSLNVLAPNLPPIAVAENVAAECQGLSGTTVTLDGSGSTDPEAGQLLYSWYDNGVLIAGPTTSPSSDIVLTIGQYQFMLMVEDECGKTASDLVDIEVVDTTDPSVVAAFLPTSQPNEYQISCQATDICSENITTSSVIKFPDLTNPKLKLKNQSNYSLEIDRKKNEVTVAAPNVSAFWALLQSQGGVAVNDGQIIKAKYDKSKYKFEFDNAGNLVSVYGDVVVLLCRADDGNTNIATAEASLPLNVAASLASREFSTGTVAGNDPLSYPNPFSNRTTISYQVQEAGSVKITVYDHSGRQLDVLLEGRQATGTYEVSWDASGHRPGVYFYQIQQETGMYRGKLLLIRE